MEQVDVNRFHILRLRSDYMKLIFENEDLNELQQEVFDIMKKFGFKDFRADYPDFMRLSMDEPFIDWYIGKTCQEEKATKDNFFENSICFWKPTTYVPRREPDYISRKRDASISSKYWYTPKGVYRQSNHWGSGVASCDWYWKTDRCYTKYASTVKEIAVYNKKYVGFAEWSDFAPKGHIVTPLGKSLDDMYLTSFKFDRYK